MNDFRLDERAQVLPIIVIGILVIIMMGALLLDGGDLFLNKREAQAAADAGALAGAQKICLNQNLRKFNYPSYETLVKTTAEKYAQSENLATSVTVTLEKNEEISDIVKVEVAVSNSSFFASIFGENSLTANAVAEAGCFPPEGNYVMPVAWSCRPPVGGAVFDPDLGCRMQALYYPGDLRNLIKGALNQIQIEGNVGNYKMLGTNIVNIDTGYPPKQIYIVMDKIALGTETYCKEDFYTTDPECSTEACKAAITCDLDGDGKYDIEGGGNRGWLDLNNSGGGASDMASWITNGLNFPIYRHSWLTGQPGAVESVFEAMRSKLGRIVLIPVFNAICADDSDPRNNAICMNDAHTDPWEEEPASGDNDPDCDDGNCNGKPKFHVIEFAPFYISCVHSKSKDYCPGFSLAQEMNPDPKNDKKSLIPDNTLSVEGFFLEDYDFPLTTEEACLVNLGNCLPSLTK